ncbi:hypothetical protein OAN22_00945 [Alphaproteobacteria bacterium]|nr:hypothetical protein [Alphaproteobacteria bacterium]
MIRKISKFILFMGVLALWSDAAQAAQVTIETAFADVTKFVHDVREGDAWDDEAILACRSKVLKPALTSMATDKEGSIEHCTVWAMAHLFGDDSQYGSDRFEDVVACFFEGKGNEIKLIPQIHDLIASLVQSETRFQNSPKKSRDRAGVDLSAQVIEPVLAALDGWIARCLALQTVSAIDREKNQRWEDVEKALQGGKVLEGNLTRVENDDVAALKLDFEKVRTAKRQEVVDTVNLGAGSALEDFRKNRVTKANVAGHLQAMEKALENHKGEHPESASEMALICALLDPENLHLSDVSQMIASENHERGQQLATRFGRWTSGDHKWIAQTRASFKKAADERVKAGIMAREAVKKAAEVDALKSADVAYQDLISLYRLGTSIDIKRHQALVRKVKTAGKLTGLSQENRVNYWIARHIGDAQFCTWDKLDESLLDTLFSRRIKGLVETILTAQDQGEEPDFVELNKVLVSLGAIAAKV